MMGCARRTGDDGLDTDGDDGLDTDREAPMPVIDIHVAAKYVDHFLSTEERFNLMRTRQ
jgi:hypothetical protein